MSQTQQSTANHSSRFTDGEFQPNRPKSADNLLMEYLCVVKQRKIPIDEYKEYVEGQSETIREINTAFLQTKSQANNYCNVFLTAKIEHVTPEQVFYAVPVCDIEHRTAFQEHLNETYTYKFCEPFNEIRVKYLCAANVGQNWCRGEIVDVVTETQLMVYLLDYGRTVAVDRKDVCLLKFAHALIRPFALKCRLAILNGIAMRFCQALQHRMFNKFRKIAKESRTVSIYLNKSNSTNADFYADVLVFTDFQLKAKSKRLAYSLHEAYGCFYRPNIRIDDEVCELWLNNIKSMEHAINSNATKRISVFLTHIESPTEFYVQCVPVKLFMSKIRRIIDGFASAQLVNFDFNSVNWTINDDCLVRTQNWHTKANLKLWYRGRIIAVDERAPCKYTVLLVDYGRRTEASRMDLMTVSPALAACSKAAQKCTLAISRRWHPSAADIFKETIVQYRAFAISCEQKIAEPMNTIMYVDLWATNSSSPEVNELSIWTNIGYIIICTAIRKSLQPFILETQHKFNESKRMQDDDDNGTQISLSLTDEDKTNEQQISYASNMEKGNNNNNNGRCDDDGDYMVECDLLAHEPIVKKWSKPLMFDNDVLTFRGTITHISKRGVIYVQKEGCLELAQDVSAMVSNHLLKARNVCVQREWKTGDTCFAKYEDNEYHRAVIKHIYAEQGTCLVKYVDYGTQDTRKLEDLRLATMFHDLPILADRCYLPNVKSSSNTGKWSPNIFHPFNEKMREKFCKIRIIRDIRGFMHKKYWPCSIDPIYHPEQAYNWLRDEKLADHTDYDSDNDEILYVG